MALAVEEAMNAREVRITSASPSAFLMTFMSLLVRFKGWDSFTSRHGTAPPASTVPFLAPSRASHLTRITNYSLACGVYYVDHLAHASESMCPLKRVQQITNSRQINRSPVLAGSNISL